MNFRAELTETHTGTSYAVMFGEASFVAFDFYGISIADNHYTGPLDRQLSASAKSMIWKAAARARLEMPGPYGKRASARRRKFCQRIADIATELEATL